MPPAPDTALSRATRWFERVIVVSLVFMMMVVVALSTVELGWMILKDIITPPILLLDLSELLDLFGFFLLILVGVELLDTIKAYVRDGVLHTEVVLEVALIAVARKVIVLDLSKHDGFSVLALAALILALAVAFFLQRRARRANQATSTTPAEPSSPL
jgi:uncharacterized membrane protein (DUF373 family)